MSQEYHVVVGSYDTTSVVLHTDPDCTYLDGSESRPVTRDKMPDRDVCSRCRDAQPANEPDWSYQESIKEAAK